MPHTSRNATPSARELLVPWVLAFLAALAAVRIVVPLAALAASGHKLPGLPRYDYVPFTGDSTGFYAAAREFLASWGRLPHAVLAALVLAAAAGVIALVRAWRRGVRRDWLLAAAVLGFALVVSAAVAEMHPPGAGVFGWSLVWSLPMLPYRALGFPLDPDIAFGFGLTLSLLANVVTIAATAIAGLYATGRRSVALLAAVLFAFWPLLVGLVGGARAWGNGTWTVDAGLAMYGEPLSTALVTVALALLLSPRLTPVRLTLAGVALSLATAVKLTNAIAAVAALALLALRFRKPGPVLPCLAGVLSFAPLIAAFWPKGYSTLRDDPEYWPRHPFSLHYAGRSWNDSLLFGPRALLILVPLAVVGAVVVRRWWPLLVLGAWILCNAAFYTFYFATPDHPRFLFASLPALFVLWSLGALTVASLVRQSVLGGRYTLQSPSSTGR